MRWWYWECRETALASIEVLACPSVFFQSPVSKLVLFCTDTVCRRWAGVNRLCFCPAVCPWGSYWCLILTVHSQTKGQTQWPQGNHESGNRRRIQFPGSLLEILRFLSVRDSFLPGVNFYVCRMKDHLFIHSLNINCRAQTPQLWGFRKERKMKIPTMVLELYGSRAVSHNTRGKLLDGKNFAFIHCCIPHLALKNHPQGTQLISMEWLNKCHLAQKVK